MAKKSKKIAAAIAAGLAAYGASKMFGKKGIGEKAASAMGPSYDEAGVSMLRPEDTSARARIRSIGRRKMYQDMPMSGQDEMFGLGAMDGAKYGKMMKAKGGTMVMARGQKLGRKKPTKIC